MERSTEAIAYIVRISREPLRRPGVRGHVEDAISGKRRYFSSIDELVAFVRHAAEPEARR